MNQDYFDKDRISIYMDNDHIIHFLYLINSDNFYVVVVAAAVNFKVVKAETTIRPRYTAGRITEPENDILALIRPNPLSGQNFGQITGLTHYPAAG